MSPTSATLPKRLQELEVRPLTRSDGRALAQGFELLSANSRRLRWGLPVKEPGWRLDWVTQLGGSEHVAIAAVQRTDGFPVAVARYVQTDPRSAELALTVADRWQGLGLGTLLLAQLIELALSRGVALLRATVFVENTRARRMLLRVGGREKFKQGVIEFEVPLLGECAR